MILLPVECPRCNKFQNVVKNGQSRAGVQRYRCNDCMKIFQIDFVNNGSKPGVKEQIARMAINGSGSRDIARVLGVATNTVTAVLKGLPGAVTAGQHNVTQPVITLMIDEQWCFVGKKNDPHWLFIAFDVRQRRVLAHACGPRNGETLSLLLDRLQGYRIEIVLTDDWPPYRQLSQHYTHFAVKKFMQILERFNLNVRTHLKRFCRRTVCFSKSKEVHDRVVDHYMLINHYQHY